MEISVAELYEFFSECKSKEEELRSQISNQTLLINYYQATVKVLKDQINFAKSQGQAVRAVPKVNYDKSIEDKELDF